jgi:hypothetical protein
MTFKRVGTATGFIGRYGAIGNSTNYQTAGKIGDIANQLRRSFHRGQELLSARRRRHTPSHASLSVKVSPVQAQQPAVSLLSAVRERK